MDASAVNGSPTIHLERNLSVVRKIQLLARSSAENVVVVEGRRERREGSEKKPCGQREKSEGRALGSHNMLTARAPAASDLRGRGRKGSGGG